MDEARRFFRYILPGCIFIIQLVIGIAISDPWFFTEQRIDLLKTMNIGTTIFASLILTGVFGYVFTTAYYVLHWCSWIPFFTPLDHKSVLKDMIDEQIITVYNSKNHRECLYDLPAIDFVSLFTFIWYSNQSSGNILEKIEKTSERLANIKHGTGACIVSLCVSFIIWVIIHYYCSLKWLDAGAIFVVIEVFFLLIIFGVNYRTLRKQSQMIQNSALATFLYKKELKPMSFNFCNNFDIKNRSTKSSCK
jgi:hypothetical protein